MQLLIYTYISRFNSSFFSFFEMANANLAQTIGDGSVVAPTFTTYMVEEDQILPDMSEVERQVSS